MDWSLRACSRRGHVTYAPDEPHLRRRLRADTALGEAWRCLRCGDFTLGPPYGEGPADEAPLVLRGRALRDAAVLRLLALERCARGLLLFLAAYGVWRFKGGREAVDRAFEEYLPCSRRWPTGSAGAWPTPSSSTPCTSCWRPARGR
ncbi:hypothetical protein [Nonomuraea recticatena]|uniref:hypothetical protein n=1 Tax=Nonomuraea recticatena TaxID=46178 RepID=UPI00360FF8CC